jgi:hypothetical protein
VELLTSDVHSGFALPLPTKAIFKIPDVVLAPVGIANQLRISNNGEVIEKNRLTHDQTFKFGPEKSLNNRMRMSEVNPVVVGWCLSGLLHYIVDLRRRQPCTKIFLMKTDWNRAFQRGHLSAPDAAASSCLATPETCLLSLRMTFGGRANPSEWSNISESACGLVNALQTLPNFHPESYLHLTPAKIPTKSPLDEDIPFKQAGHLSVNIEENDCGKSDIYLDDNIGIAPDLQDNVRPLSIIMPLVIYLLGRPLHASEPIIRKWLLSLSKFAAGGRPEEIKIVLGWLLDTRQRLISLPEYKQIVWKDQIQTILKESKATLEELENIKERLTHLACVDRAARHFLGRINHMVTKLNRQNVNRTRQKFCLPQEVIKDFLLMLKFIDRARAGISMNLLVHRSIGIYLRTGACFFGLGWLCWCCGRTYGLEIPPDRWLTKPQNFMDFLSCCAALLEHPAFGEDTCVCCLKQTDNTNAEGWLHKTNFYDDPEKIALARWLAEHQIKHKYCLYSQWFAGKANIVSDSLSIDHHFSGTELTSHLLSQYPKQLPKHFRICPVSKETRS